MTCSEIIEAQEPLRDEAVSIVEDLLKVLARADRIHGLSADVCYDFQERCAALMLSYCVTETDTVDEARELFEKTYEAPARCQA